MKAKEFYKLQRHVWRNLKGLVGVGLFIDVLQTAAFQLLDSVESGQLNREALFSPDNESLERAINEAVSEAINLDFGAACDIPDALLCALDETSFRYFEEEWKRNAARRQRQATLRQLKDTDSK